MNLSAPWVEALDILDYAFQPVVNLHTGACSGYEALLRNHKEAGFGSIHGLLDAAFDEDSLHELDLSLREKAFERFIELSRGREVLLYFNLDNRILMTNDYTPGNTHRMLGRFGLRPEQVCFEISERHRFHSYLQMRDLLVAYHAQGFKIAIDDYGDMYAGLQLLYHCDPDILKISRFLISDIHRDPKKRLFVSALIGMAHTLGVTIVAEGIETEAELDTCRDLGCDLGQGYYIQRPTLDLERLRASSEESPKIVVDRRADSKEKELLRSLIQYLPCVSLDQGTGAVFEAFQAHNEMSLIPAVNGLGEPVGVIRERDIKPYAYSNYGKDLLRNPSFTKSLYRFITRCPVAEVDLQAEKILELFSLSEGSEGILMTKGGRYLGFLTAASLLRILSEKNLQAARDQNPLTRLPGNTLIHEFLSKALENPELSSVFIYFDLDHFKAFNDRYGFRQGDRAIILFADILRVKAHGERLFVGHIGGDDFFAGHSSRDESMGDTLLTVRHILKKFREDVLSLYDLKDRSRRFIRALDRDGRPREYPLLSVSAVVLHVPSGPRRHSLEDLGRIIASLKKKAKKSPDKLTFFSLNDPVSDEKESLGAS